MKFLIVDAFTDTVFGGNPAGVVILPDGADFPADTVCVSTAAELRYSETAFIKPLGNHAHCFIWASSKKTATVSITP